MNEDDQRLYRFQQECLSQQWQLDPIYESFVEAWTLYHKAADAIDGHLPLGDYSLNRAAVLAGQTALKKYMDDIGLSIPSSLFNDDVTDWNRAKIEALRRLGK